MAWQKCRSVICLPAIPFGVDCNLLDFPMAIHVSQAALDAMVQDIVESLLVHDIRKIVIINGHGGNDPIRGRLYEVANELPDLRFAWYAWWLSHSVEAIVIKHDLKPFHGGWLEAFPFTRVADLPEGEKTPPYVPGLLGAEAARETYGDGVFGGKYQVKDAIMQEIFDAVVADVVHLLGFDE